ncbi:hypothetical protein ABK040_005534 [Willaertia magna]
MEENKLYTLRESKVTEKPRIIEIWEASVRATHHFLSEDDILKIKLQVINYVNNKSSFTLILDNKKGMICGFMGMTENKIDSLFIDPSSFRKGFGKMFIQYALTLYSQLYVDVNEHNTEALAFYEKMGFYVFNRSELDDEGRPFPILKMVMTKGK